MAAGLRSCESPGHGSHGRGWSRSHAANRPHHVEVILDGTWTGGRGTACGRPGIPCTPAHGSHGVTRLTFVHHINAMPIVHITRRERFSAAHRLGRPEWSAKRNLATFGKCANPNWHGHNYELWVTVKGETDRETGFVINLSDLGKVMHEHVIDLVDHKNLDLDVPFMAGLNSTTENLAVAIWRQLEEPVRRIGGILHCVKLQETENNSVEYYGE